jgi:hypothetical protein
MVDVVVMGHNKSLSPVSNDMKICDEIRHVYREAEDPDRVSDYDDITPSDLPHEKYATNHFNDFDYRGPLQLIKNPYQVTPETPTIRMDECTYMRCKYGTTDYSEPTQEMSDNMPASRILLFDNGEFVGFMDRYIGNYEKGLMHGPGKVTNIGGSPIIYYQGEFKDNKAVSTAKNVTIIYGGEILDNNNLESMTYTGEIINGKRNGSGILTQMTRDGITRKYKGEWYLDKRNGKGSQSEDNHQYGKDHIKIITTGIWKDNGCYENVMIEYPLTGMRFRWCYFKYTDEDEVMISAVVEMRNNRKKYIEYGKLELESNPEIYKFIRSGINTRKVYKNITINRNGDLVNTENNTLLLKDKSERRDTRRKVKINMVPEVSYVSTRYLPLDVFDRGKKPVTRSDSSTEIEKNRLYWGKKKESKKPKSVRGGRKEKRTTRRNKR